MRQDSPGETATNPLTIWDKSLKPHREETQEKTMTPFDQMHSAVCDLEDIL